jgi:hypothetical protein
MSAQSSTQWFWTDWLGDQAVRRLTLVERGLWIDLLALAAVGSPTGYVCDDRGMPLTHEEIARVTNAGSPVEVAKLIEAIVEKGVASRDRTGRLFNRRMVRQTELSAKKKRAGKIGGDHTKLKWQGFQSLPQQVPRQMPQHVPQHRVAAPSLKRKITSSEQEAARPQEVNSGENNEAAGSLASAQPSGALTSQPSAEPAAQGPTDSPPSDEAQQAFNKERRAQLDAMLLAKRKPAAPEQPVAAAPADDAIPLFLQRKRA